MHPFFCLPSTDVSETFRRSRSTNKATEKKTPITEVTLAFSVRGDRESRENFQTAVTLEDWKRKNPAGWRCDWPLTQIHNSIISLCLTSPSLCRPSRPSLFLFYITLISFE